MHAFISIFKVLETYKFVNTRTHIYAIINHLIRNPGHNMLRTRKIRSVNRADWHYEVHQLFPGGPRNWELAWTASYSFPSHPFHSYFLPLLSPYPATHAFPSRLSFLLTPTSHDIITKCNWRNKPSFSLLLYFLYFVYRAMQSPPCRYAEPYLNERYPLCWTEWKINFPIFIFWIMVACIYNLPVCYLNFKVCHRPKKNVVVRKWPNLQKRCAMCWNE